MCVSAGYNCMRLFNVCGVYADERGQGSWFDETVQVCLGRTCVAGGCLWPGCV